MHHVYVLATTMPTHAMRRGDRVNRRARFRPLPALVVVFVLTLFAVLAGGVTQPTAAHAGVKLVGGNTVFSSHHGVIRKKRLRHIGRVGATWYGPGFFGNRTACGRTLKKRTWGVAHRSLPCGTLVFLKYRGKQIAVPVVDRGPFGTYAQFDLTSRTAYKLGLTKYGHGTVQAAVMQGRRVAIKRL